MPDFEGVLRTLLAHRRLRRDQTRPLSGLGPRQVDRLKAVWPSLADPERLNLLATLRRQAEADIMMDFDPVYAMAMDDPNADVRRLAVAASQSDENPDLLDKLLELCAYDPDEMVRAAAAERLAGYAYEAEVGTFSDSDARRIQDVLLERARSETETPGVRTAALASAGYFSTEEVQSELRRAISRSSLRLAAIRGIGRNCDPSWSAVLVEQMGSEDAAVRREAATAAADCDGTLVALSGLVDDPDVSVRLAAISALGKTGGAEAREILVYCHESPDADIRKAAAEALREIDETEDPFGTAGLGAGDQ